MAGNEKTLVDAFLSHPNFGSFLAIIFYGFIEFAKSMMFAKRRAEDDEFKEKMKCRFDHDDVRDIREAAFRLNRRSTDKD